MTIRLKLWGLRCTEHILPCGLAVSACPGRPNSGTCFYLWDLFDLLSSWRTMDSFPTVKYVIAQCTHMHMCLLFSLRVYVLLGSFKSIVLFLWYEQTYTAFKCLLCWQFLPWCTHMPRPIAVPLFCFCPWPFESLCTPLGQSTEHKTQSAWPHRARKVVFNVIIVVIYEHGLNQMFAAQCIPPFLYSY